MAEFDMQYGENYKKLHNDQTMVIPQGDNLKEATKISYSKNEEAKTDQPIEMKGNLYKWSPALFQGW